MIIHVVKPGDTIYKIARMYNITPQKIIIDNELRYPNDLVVGQTLVILVPDQVHVVQPGDTLEKIARKYNTTVIELLQINPQITYADSIYPGDKITISLDQEKKGNISVLGYAYPNINRTVLMKTLPYLTYLTVFNYNVTPEGNLVNIDDDDLIKIAKDYGVAPLMLISNIGKNGGFDSELVGQILNNPEAQNNLIENVIKTMKQKGYVGLDIDFEYVPPKDREKFISFVQNMTNRLNQEGYTVLTALAPKISDNQIGLLYEAHDYEKLGDVSNRVLLMTYEWGYTFGPAMAVAPLNKVKEVLDYAVTKIPREKIFMGIPNYGYDFKLPYEQGVSKARSLSNVQAVQLAKDVGASIKYDELAQSPYFIYFDNEGKQHEVWFEDARSVKAKLDLFSDYGFEGVGYWNIMRYFPQNWLVLSSLYDIDKVL